MNTVIDIISIIKYKGKYMIYFPYLKEDKHLYMEQKVCRWWGRYDTFDKCVEILMEKNQYNHLVIDKGLLRQIKINKIQNEKNKKI